MPEPDYTVVFAALANHGRKDYEFSQKASLATFRTGAFAAPSVFGAVRSGVCSTVAVAWLADKTMTSSEKRHAAERPFKPANSWFKSSAKALHDTHVRNAATMQSVVPIHGSTQGAVALLRHYGLATETPKTLGIGIRRASQVADRYEPAVRGNDSPLTLGQTLAKCVAALQNKHGLYVEFCVNDAESDDEERLGRHGVAAYRSGRGELQFFDANCGAYTVPQPQRLAFFTAWEAAYRDGRKQRFSFESQSDGYWFVRQMTPTEKQAGLSGVSGPS